MCTCHMHAWMFNGRTCFVIDLERVVHGSGGVTKKIVHKAGEGVGSAVGVIAVVRLSLRQCYQSQKEEH